MNTLGTPKEIIETAGVSRRSLAIYSRIGMLSAMAGADVLLTSCGNGSQATGTYSETPTPTRADIPKTAQVPNSERLRSNDQVVQGLGDLEQRCQQEIFSYDMQFFAPSIDDATNWQISSVQASVSTSLNPLVILDTDNVNLDNIDGTNVSEYFSTFFKALNNSDISPDQLGPIAVCPEFIAGYQGNPVNYAKDVNTFLSRLQEFAPNSASSIMLDTSEFQDLSPYFKDIDLGKLDSIGIQSFANAAKIPFGADGKADVSGFLDATNIKQVVAQLGFKPVWINTGITREDANLGVSYTLKERQAIASAIADVVEQLKSEGVDVTILNLFAENKLNGAIPGDQIEKRDFSFHPGDESILINFADRMRKLSVSLSGFALKNDTSVK